MIIEVWVVMMPNGDRPFTRATPPLSQLAKAWKEEGARIFRLTGQVADIPGETPAQQALVGSIPRPDLGEHVVQQLELQLPAATIEEL